jgi:hypothetical protein
VSDFDIHGVWFWVLLLPIAVLPPCIISYILGPFFVCDFNGVAFVFSEASV